MVAGGKAAANGGTTIGIVLGDLMEDMKIADVFDRANAGSKVRLKGWVHRARSSGGIAFTILRDSTGVIQLVTVKDGVDEDSFIGAKGASKEASVVVEGMVRTDERAPGGREVLVERFNVVGASDNFPIARDLSQEYLLDVRHLWLRSRRMTALLKIRSTVFGAIHEYMRGEEFCEVQPPMFTEAGSEGGATLFEVSYFDRKVNLSQSWQLYAEAFIFSVEKAYTIAPSFRAERSKTARHLTEFWHAEVEGAWMGFEEILRVAEELVSHVCRRVGERNEDELSTLGCPVDDMRSIVPPFPRITYYEALAMLREAGFHTETGSDLGQPEEREIGKFFGKPVFVTHYLMDKMPFYKARDPSESGLCLNFNLIVPDVGEILDGSEREADIEAILNRMKSDGIDPAQYQWYLDSRRYGSVPHSGFGLGIDRLVMWICGLDSIKDAIAFPRTMTRTIP